MLTEPDFVAKKVILFFPKNGDKLSIKNDNLTIYDENHKMKLQISCYKIFCIFIVGGFVLTTGLIEKCKRFGFSIVFLTHSFKVYEKINFKMEGNTLLRKKQYTTDKKLEIGKSLIINKIENQRDTLKKTRNASYMEGIIKLDQNIEKLITNKLNSYEIMGIEGTSAKIYFNRMFEEMNWNGRQPRVKRDEINLLLDIGYTILFNYIEAIVNLYGFDIYVGNLHKEFYKRKSLICDLIEPFRPIIDYRIRKGYNLKQFDYKYTKDNGQYSLDWKQSEEFVQIILKEIVSYEHQIFIFIQSYYRWFMKDKNMSEFPKVRLVE